uniref:Uncharacterized protein n=1 Tax=Zea mays TaxID=4577 RepID=B6UDM6_MAIZE|nr:hypothetical protein [Zea mays]
MHEQQQPGSPRVACADPICAAPTCDITIPLVPRCPAPLDSLNIKSIKCAFKYVCKLAALRRCRASRVACSTKIPSPWTAHVQLKSDWPGCLMYVYFTHCDLVDGVFICVG